MSTALVPIPQPDQAAVEIIAQALAGGLTHPGTFGPTGQSISGAIVLPLPMFRTSNIPPEMAAHFAQEAGLPHADIARLTAEAIVHTLNQGGIETVTGAELTRLRAVDTAAEPDRKRSPMFTCHCDVPLFRTNVTDLDTDKPKVFGNQLITAIQKLHPDCALGHRPPEVS